MQAQGFFLRILFFFFFVVPAGSSGRAWLARLCQARSQVSSAARKSRCTTRRSAASSRRSTAGARAGAARTGSLLRRGPPIPLKGAAEVEQSLFITSPGPRPRSSDVGVTASPEAPGYPELAWAKRESAHLFAHTPSRGRFPERKRKGPEAKAELAWRLGKQFTRRICRILASLEYLALASPAPRHVQELPQLSAPGYDQRQIGRAHV